MALRRATGAVCVGPNNGFENRRYHAPYNTVREGVTHVPVDNYVLIKPGNFDEVTPWNDISGP